MRVMLTSVGHAGDVFPFFALALALRQREHRATLLLNPHFQALADELKLDFHPLVPPPTARRALSPIDLHRPVAGMWRLWSEIVLPNVPILLEALRDRCRAEKFDWVVYHPASIGVPWICRREGMRCAAATLVPKAWLDYNRGDVHGVAAPVETTSERRLRAVLRFLRPPARFFSDRALNRLRARYGFAPQRDVFCRQFLDNDLNLGFWSPHLRPQLPHDPQEGRICGFTWFDGRSGSAREQGELEQFLADGPPPIVFTLGTGIISIAGNFYELAAESCRRLGRRGLLLTGSAANIPRRLPAGVRAFEYVPLSSVLPRGCLTVHHGGIGTVGQALRAGKPMLIIPFVRDQFDNAKLARRMGVSMTFEHRPASAVSLTASLKKLLDHTGVAERAARIGDLMKGEDGARRAAELLEAAN